MPKAASRVILGTARMASSAVSTTDDAPAPTVPMSRSVAPVSPSYSTRPLPSLAVAISQVLPSPATQLACESTLSSGTSTLLKASATTWCGVPASASSASSSSSSGSRS